ncbi:MAG TPA: sucrase ferredoxin [Thermoanaerobaculia bacterium]|nr:sucrase ferredoxin [Thermoanaerobaculia bacterium]
MTRRVYCSDAARLRGDDNAATAARVDVWILVELPSTWGRDPLTDAAIPHAVRESLVNASIAIPRNRVVFIRRRVECVGPTRVYIVRSAPVAGILAAFDLATIDEVADVPFGAIALREPAVPAQPLVLVCTHGQHDSCCGRRGYPLYDALRDREDLDVWQCSHIGGDRFAANAVVLPWGLYYGPVEPRDADLLADSIARDEILLPAYRGRSSLSRPVQAADIHVRRILNLTPRDALRFVDRTALGDNLTRVQLRERNGTLHDVTIEYYAASEPVRPSCLATKANAIRQFRVVEYRASLGTTSP